MFRSTEIRTELNKYFTYLAMLIQNENIEGRNDINKDCEEIIKNVLNIIYDLQLRNVNDIRINYPAIDLADEGNKICYQITSNLSNQKIKETIEKFEKYAFKDKYCTLKILYLKSEQRKKYTKGTENENYKVVFLCDLLRDIRESNKFEEVLTYLRQEVGIKMIEKGNKSINYNEVPLLDVTTNSMIYIDDYNESYSEDIMYNFYGNCFNFTSSNEEVQAFRVELEIINSGNIAISNISINSFSVSFNTGEVYRNEYTTAPICEYSRNEEIYNLIAPNKSMKLNIIFEDNWHDEIEDEIIIEFSLSIISDFSPYKNTMWYQIFCNRVHEHNSQDAEKNIKGNYMIKAMQIRSQVYNK